MLYLYLNKSIILIEMLKIKINNRDINKSKYFNNAKLEIFR